VPLRQQPSAFVFAPRAATSTVATAAAGPGAEAGPGLSLSSSQSFAQQQSPVYGAHAAGPALIGLNGQPQKSLAPAQAQAQAHTTLHGLRLSTAPAVGSGGASAFSRPAAGIAAAVAAADGARRLPAAAPVSMTVAASPAASPGSSGSDSDQPLPLRTAAPPAASPGAEGKPFFVSLVSVGVHVGPAEVSQRSASPLLPPADTAPAAMDFAPPRGPVEFPDRIAQRTPASTSGAHVIAFQQGPRALPVAPAAHAVAPSAFRSPQNDYGDGEGDDAAGARASGPRGFAGTDDDDDDDDDDNYNDASAASPPAAGAESGPRSLSSGAGPKRAKLLWSPAVARPVTAAPPGAGSAAGAGAGDDASSAQRTPLRGRFSALKLSASTKRYGHMAAIAFDSGRRAPGTADTGEHTPAGLATNGALRAMLSDDALTDGVGAPAEVAALASPAFVSPVPASPSRPPMGALPGGSARALKRMRAATVDAAGFQRGDRFDEADEETEDQ
jgi:hypothetical protein